MERPQVISKLASYLQDKEPLVYLFIINSDFVLDEELLKGLGMAGVSLKNGRIIFHYTKVFIELNVNVLYYIILHEAYHIFKKHLEYFDDLQKEDVILLNIVQDAIINEELDSSVFNYSLKPSAFNGHITIPDKFKSEYINLGKNAFTTRRLYGWMKKQRVDYDEKAKKQLLKEGSYCKNKCSSKYGKIVLKNDKGDFQVSERTKDEIINEIFNKKSPKNNSTTTEKLENLIPVLTTEQFNSKFNPGSGGTEIEILGDFFPNIEEEENIEEDAANNTLLEKMVEKTKEMYKTIKNAGLGTGGYFSKIEDLFHPKVSWKKVLRNHLNLFYSNKSYDTEKSKSFLTYLWNPKSRYDILCKHFIEKKNHIQSYIVLAIDTSGSVFFDPIELKTFFSEIEAISKWLKFSKLGNVFTLMWDTEIKEELKIYNEKDWKNFKTKGGGGTTPKCIFDYLTKVYEKKNGYYNVKVGKNNFSFTDEKKLPFLIVLTDGYFYSNLKKKDLGIYEKNPKNVLFFTKYEHNLYKDAEKIIYE